MKNLICLILALTLLLAALCGCSKPAESGALSTGGGSGNESESESESKSTSAESGEESENSSLSSQGDIIIPEQNEPIIPDGWVVHEVEANIEELIIVRDENGAHDRFGDLIGTCTFSFALPSDWVPIENGSSEKQWSNGSIIFTCVNVYEVDLKEYFDYIEEYAPWPMSLSWIDLEPGYIDSVVPPAQKEFVGQPQEHNHLVYIPLGDRLAFFSFSERLPWGSEVISEDLIEFIKTFALTVS